MRLTIKTTSATYPVIIEPRAIQKFHWPKNSIVITDTKVQRHYGKQFSAIRHFPVVTFAAGETNKRLTTVETICEQLVRLGADRSTNIIAFGGGVVGDVAGLVASVYMRGVPLYHIPTTLLAMVDSSLGGKTGVDLVAGKNLVGTIYQPQAVIMDPQFIIDLPDEQFRNGMGEIVKHGVIDGTLFKWLEKNSDAIIRRDKTCIAEMISKNVRIKARIVSADEREAGQRMMLNLGHTFGHAIEKLSKYSIPHGEAVAIGLQYAVQYAEQTRTHKVRTSQVPSNQARTSQLGIDVDRVSALLHTFGLPTQLTTPFAPKEMVQAMMSDKKNRAQHITLILPRALGDIHIQSGISPKKIERFLQTYAQ